MFKIHSISNLPTKRRLNYDFYQFLMSKSRKISQKMSFFKNIFGSSETTNSSGNKLNWNELTNLGQLNEIISLSSEMPVAIFKHSTRCSVSRMALRQFENEFDSSNKVTPYFLDLISFRDVSNEIASRFGVLHQSPQLILIKDGKAVYDASHSDIDAEALKRKL